MTRTKLLLLPLLLASAVPAAAQNSLAVPASATVEVLPFLNLTKDLDMLFGQHYASDGVVFPTQVAKWSGQTDVGNQLSFAFALPGTLTRSGGMTVPFTCGNQSTRIVGGSADIIGDPNLGASTTVNGSGMYEVFLGDAPGGNKCSVDLAGKLKGIYTGTITLTVAIL